MEDLVTANNPWHGRRVFLTGHTGFKGGWLALWLAHLGAEVRGYALDPATEPNFFTSARVGSLLDDVRGDLREGPRLQAALEQWQPEVVFHLAAQPLVRASYADPVGTYETNVLGTARVLEAVRHTGTVRAVVCVTTDKCYENREWAWGYRETDALGGFDPYSSSKACAELVASAYRQSFFANAVSDGQRVALATARAGNVIGGGDWSTDRLLPDLLRGFEAGQAVPIRRPDSIRPWQHVLEPLHGYLRLAEHLLSTNGSRYATAFNFGPADTGAQPVRWIAEHVATLWGQPAHWVLDPEPGVHEAGYLKLDSSRAHAELGWRPRLELAEALRWTVEWHRSLQAGAGMQAFSLGQIAEYERLAGPAEAPLSR